MKKNNDTPTMAIRNAGFGANPKVSAFYTTRIAYIYE